MTKWGKFDFKEVKAMAKNIEKVMDENVIEGFIQDFIKEMANRALRMIKKRAREMSAGKSSTGALKDRWYVSEIKKVGDEYSVEIYCPMEYASYVEYGFRSHFVPGYWSGDHFVYDRDYKPTSEEPAGMWVGKGKPWVEGKFIMTIPMKEIEKQIPKYLEKRQKQLFEKLMGGR